MVRCGLEQTLQSDRTRFESQFCRFLARRLWAISLNLSFLIFEVGIITPDK